MGTLKWYPRDPRAALLGMAGLSLADCGAYNTVLDLIYIHDGKCPDNSKKIAAHLGVDVRRWMRIRKRLIERGKIYIYKNELHNERADIEVEKILKKIAQTAQAANQRWGAYNEIKRLADADAMQPTSRLRKLVSANIVPISKKTSEKEKK
jgi:uncharacterized protein YdaU (DUF1376 family)